MTEWHRNFGTTESRLQLLRQPVSRVRSLQRPCDQLRMPNHFAQVCPYQLIKLLDRNPSRLASLFSRRIELVAVTLTSVIFLPCVTGPPDARQLTLATTHQRTQQIFRGVVIAAGEFLILLKL